MKNNTFLTISGIIAGNAIVYNDCVVMDKYV